MATNLKKTDVVIVGLGAVGGVAALQLAQAGLEVNGGPQPGETTRPTFAKAPLQTRQHC